MALIRTGALVQSIAGSIASETYHASGGGGYVKRRGRGPSRRSPLSDNKDSAVQRCVREWGLMLDYQKTSWQQAAARGMRVNAVGQVVKVNGRGLFLSINIPLAQIGQPFQHIAPANPTRQQVESATVTVTSAGAGCHFVTGAMPNGWCFVQGGRGFGFRPMNPRRWAQVAAFRYVAGTVTVGFSAGWESAMGFCSIGERAYLRLSVLPDGQWRGPWRVFMTDVLI